MKKGINTWAFRAGMPLEQIFSLAARTGYEGVELVLDESGPVNLCSTEEDMSLVKKLAKDAGISLYSLATGLYWKYSLTSDDPSLRAKARYVVRRQLELASQLGCDTILVVPGAVSVEFAPELSVVPYDTAYNRALEAIEELREDAQKLGVCIGVENVWNNFLLSPLEFRDFIDRVDSKWVGAFFDVGNVVKFGYPEHWINILGQRIQKIHFKDFRRGAGNLAGFVDLLSGDVDYIAVMNALREIGYDGWVTAEMLPPYASYPDQLIYNTSGAMDRILGRVK